MDTYKIYALHFEPQREMLLNRFIDSEGNLLIKPDYEIEIDKNHYEFITNIVSEFPKKLDFGWMCLPFYRDVFVWKNLDGTVFRTFEMCFSCDHYALSDGQINNLIIELSEESIFEESIERLKSYFRYFDKVVDYQRMEMR
jgi:hypothetical protein